LLNQLVLVITSIKRRKKKKGGDVLAVGSFYVPLLSCPSQMSVRANNSTKSSMTGGDYNHKKLTTSFIFCQ
jgi:hypothetical protein